MSEAVTVERDARLDAREGALASAGKRTPRWKGK